MSILTVDHGASTAEIARKLLARPDAERAVSEMLGLSLAFANATTRALQDNASEEDIDNAAATQLMFFDAMGRAGKGEQVIFPDRPTAFFDTAFPNVRLAWHRVHRMMVFAHAIWTRAGREVTAANIRDVTPVVGSEDWRRKPH